MSSDVVACVGCGLKANITTEQLCGHVYCQDCISNAKLIGQPVCSLVHSEEEQLEGSTKLDGYVCCYCNSPLDFDDRQSHFEVCEFYPISCPLNCEKKCLRSQVEIHLQECSRKLHQCSFLPLGCSFQGSRAEIENHDNDKIHLKLITNSLLNLQNEISSIKSQTARSFNELTELEDKVKNLECADEENKIKMADVAAMHKNQKLQTVIGVIIIAVVIGIIIHNLKADCTSNHTYIWKVEKFTQLQNNAKRKNEDIVYSNSFYTHEFGYKIRILLYPNGDSRVKEIAVSIFLEIVEGPFDAILNWPLNYTATISVVSQSKSENDYSLNFKSGSFNAFAKPSSGKENSAWGFSPFMNFSKLEPFYLVDDTIFIKVHFTANPGQLSLIIIDFINYCYNFFSRNL